MKVREFIKTLDLTKYPDVTIMDWDEGMDGGDVVKGGVLKEKALKPFLDDEVDPRVFSENKGELHKGIYRTYVLPVVIDDETAQEYEEMCEAAEKACEEGDPKFDADFDEIYKQYDAENDANMKAGKPGIGFDEWMEGHPELFDKLMAD